MLILDNDFSAFLSVANSNKKNILLTKEEKFIARVKSLQKKAMENDKVRCEMIMQALRAAWVRKSHVLVKGATDALYELATR